MQISGEAMKRDILFKAKCLGNGEWIKGWYYQKPNPLTRDGEPIRHFISNCPPFGSEIDPETVCQYTGLKDRNGKQIFEGDVLLFVSKDIFLTSRYVFDSRGYRYGSMLIVAALESGFTLRSIKDNAPDIPNANCKIDNYTFWNHHNQFEIIGNIHDNPELIGIDGKETSYGE